MTNTSNLNFICYFTSHSQKLSTLRKSSYESHHICSKSNLFGVLVHLLNTNCINLVNELETQILLWFFFFQLFGQKRISIWKTWNFRVKTFTSLGCELSTRSTTEFLIIYLGQWLAANKNFTVIYRCGLFVSKLILDAC